MSSHFFGQAALRLPLALALTLALGLLAFLALAPTASAADLSICSTGPGAGQCDSPTGVALDTATNRLYVADGGNDRIDVFATSGEFLFAFGWGVRDGSNSPQTCGPAATPPSATCLEGIGGSGAGQLSRPEQIAVDSATHDVYVSESFNYRVQKFDSTGAFKWMAGGEVNQVTKANLCTVAINCGTGKETSAAVAQEGFFFETFGRGMPLAIGPGGILHVADSRKLGELESEGFNTRIQRYQPDGTYLAPQILLPPASPETVGRVQALGVDSSGSFYVATDGLYLKPGVRKFNPDGSAVTGWGEGGRMLGLNVGTLGIGPGDDLFFGDRDSESFLIRQLDPAGVQLRAIYGSGTVLGYPRLAADSSNVFVSEENGVVRIEIPPPGPLPIPGTTKATTVLAVKATLKTSFNPQGKASTARFEYVDKASYEAEGGFASPNTQVTPESAPTPGDFQTHSAESTNVCVVPTELSCLKPETTYYVRAIASNADGEVKGERAEFTTLPPVLLGETWTTEVGTDAARLHAEADPLGVKASGYFEYVEAGPDYQANGFANAKRSPTFDLGSGVGIAARSAQLVPLKVDTTYHYRVVVENPYFPAIASSERSFATFSPTGESQAICANDVFRTGPSASLPDCRAYEMVSPLDKNNGDIISLLNTPGNPTFLDQSASDGSAFTYSSYRAFEDPQSAPFTNQYLATRNELGHPEEGWQSKSLSPQGKGAEFLENPFKAFTPDLSSAWLSWRAKAGESPPDPCAPIGFSQLYRRDNGSDEFSALSCAPIEHAVDFLTFLPEIQGFSADGEISVFRANEALTPEASSAITADPPRPIFQLYLASPAGQLRLLSVLPDGTTATQDSSAGTAGDLRAGIWWSINRFASLLNAVSEDGKRVFWSRSTAGTAGPLYLRINADQEQSKIKDGKCNQPTRACTIAVSEPITAEPAHFQMGNPQGTGALFTIGGNGPLAGNLYRFDAQAQPPASQLIAEGVMNESSILGASEDLSRVYYASTKASAQAQGEGAEAGKPNVYFSEGGQTRFVATLTSASSNYGTPIDLGPVSRTARVSPGGEALVFMSNSPELAERTAGYDNTDATSPAPCGKAGGICDAEVYLYDAEAEAGAGKLRCVSCNPSGARPVGREIAPGDNGEIGPYGAATIPRFQSQLHQPRYLSDGGQRVFFNSFEALVLGDTNGKQDVYQWQAPGSGDCTSESAAFVSSSEGCLRLISSGQSPADSELLDASPSGSDVFFTTVEDLVAQDYGLVDVYDARVEGGFPPPPGRPAACEGEACQGPLSAPDDPTPASMAFQGAGNVKAEPTRARCAKGKARRKGRCVARKQRKGATKAKHRANHDRRAQR